MFLVYVALLLDHVAPPLDYVALPLDYLSHFLVYLAAPQHVGYLILRFVYLGAQYLLVGKITFQGKKSSHWTEKPIYSHGNGWC